MIHAMNLFSGLSLLCLFAVGTATAQPSGRVKLNEGWRFYRGDAAPGDSLRLSYERLKPFLLRSSLLFLMALPTGAISLLRSSMTRHGARSIFPMTGVSRALSGRSIPVRPGNCRGGAGHGIVVRSVSATLTSENAFSSRSTEPCLFRRCGATAVWPVDGPTAIPPTEST